MQGVRERAGNGEDSGADGSMDLGNGVHLENVGKFFFYLFCETLHYIVRGYAML